MRRLLNVCSNATGVFPAKKKRFALDLACGVGRDTFHLASSGLDVIGVDASFRGLRVAQRVKSGRGMVLALVTADGRYLPFRDRSFEGVALRANNVWPHKTKKDDTRE
jgi:ubiquinone/menaquinone biosynthesis C-methylase UbiE